MVSIGRIATGIVIAIAGTGYGYSHLGNIDGTEREKPIVRGCAQARQFLETPYAILSDGHLNYVPQPERYSGVENVGVTQGTFESDDLPNNHAVGIPCGGREKSMFGFLAAAAGLVLGGNGLKTED
jgi:hypothetical protein